MSEILTKDGQPAQPATEAAQDSAAQPEQQGVPDKPMLGIDPAGNMTLFIPLATTNDIFARGMCDLTRSKMIEWYGIQARKAAETQRQIQAVQAKGAMRRFADKIMGK